MPQVLVPLAQGCEELETATITDILVRGGVEVVTASLDEQKVITASRGLQLVASTTLADVVEHEFDLIVLPGGLPGATHLQNDQKLLAMIQRHASQNRIVAAICAAPKVLATAGLLENTQVTGFPGIVDNLEIKSMNYVDQPVVQDGNIITSVGPGTAMDFALYLLEQLQGLAKRQEVEATLHRF